MLACALRKQSSVRTALEASKRGAGNAAAGSAEGHRNGAATNTNAPSSYRGTPGGPTAAAGTKGGDSRHPPKRAVRPLWDRNQLNSQWDEVKESYCGRLGRVTRLDHIGSQVEIEFQNDPQPVQRLVYPLDAVGLPVAHDLPLNDAREMLRMGGNAIGLKVRVRDDVAFVRQCFTGHSGNIPFVEELGTDMHAVRNCGVVFLAAFLTAMAAERCGSWFHLVTVILWVAIAYDVIYLERVRCRRIELLSERQVQQQRQRSAVPDEEAVDWVNGVLWKLWTPMQKTVAKKLHASLQSTLDGCVREPYLFEIEIDAVKVGSLPPTVRSASFEDSDVFGEFKINSNLLFVAPEARVDARVVIGACGLKLSIPIQLHDVTVKCDTQLIIRASETHGLTMVGIMLNDNLELSYGLTLCGAVQVTALPMVLRYVNHAINDSIWWMRKPHKLSIPWVQGADLDLELSKMKRNIGCLEITVVEASHLKSERRPDPYVKVSLYQRGSDIQPRFRKQTHAINKNSCPVWGHDMWTHLRADEVENGILLFEVYDKDLTFDDMIGKTEVSIHSILSDPRYVGQFDAWQHLERQESSPQRSQSGKKEADSRSLHSAKWKQSLHVQVKFHSKILEHSVPMSVDASSSQVGDVEKGIFEVTVLQCRRLIATSGNKDDPYVEVKLGDNVQRTEKIKDHCFPTWTKNNEFEFAIHDLRTLVKIIVFDDKKKKCIGCVLKDTAQNRGDFPTIPQVLERVGLLRDGRLMLMETADEWISLHDAQSARRTTQELRLRVSFRACVQVTPGRGAEHVAVGPKSSTNLNT